MLTKYIGMNVVLCYIEMFGSPQRRRAESRMVPDPMI